MALITYVDDRYKARVWKMPSYVTTITDLDEYLESRTTPGIVIVHGGQRDAQLKLLPAGPTKLVAAAQKACSGGRAIIFSGGFPMVSTDVLRQQLADSGLREGEHYLLLTAVLNLLDEVDFPLLQRTVLTPRWLVSEAKLRHAVPTLLTLGYLCQAGLLACNPLDVDHDVAELLGGVEELERIRSVCPSETRERMLAVGVWCDTLGLDNSVAIKDAIDLEWPAGVERKRGLDDLLNVIDDNGPFLPRVLSAAFAEVSEALRRNEELQN